MKLQFTKKQIAFIMTIMMFSVLPALMEAQPTCGSGHPCPSGYTCYYGYCVQHIPCNCFHRPIPFHCGQYCGFYSDPNQISDLISISEGDGNVVDINFEVAEAERVAFKIYDVTGKLVKTLDENGTSQEGHQFNWDKTDTAGYTVNPGLYILQVEAGPGYAGAKKVLVIN